MTESRKDAARRLARPILDKGFKAEALHTYFDAEGNPIYSRIRAKHPETGEKWIRPMHINGSGWQLGEPKFNGPKPLYNLHRISKAPASTPLFIVEGEKAADALTRLGVLATTSGGADSADRADWSPCRGRECVIWPDLDDAGRMYAEAVAPILKGLGCSPHRIDVEALDLPAKGDAADWVTAHPSATPADALALPRIATEATQTAEDDSSPPLPENRSGALLSGSTSIRILRGDAVKIVPIGWYWFGYLPAGKVVLIGGAPGTGKTTLAVTLAATIAIGGRWPDGARADVGDVLIWSGEDSVSDTLAGRFKAAGADMSRVHFVMGVDTEGGGRPFDPAQDFPQLVDVAARIPSLRLIIVDPIVMAVAGDSHKNAETRRGLQPLVDFAEKSGAVVLGITHFSKGTQGREPIERITGSLAFAAVARLVLVAAKVDESNGGGRVLVRSKSNLGPDGGGFKYELEQLELEPGIAASRVAWGESIDGNARDILATAEVVPEADDDREETRGAAEWLRDLLQPGELLKTEVMRRASEAGFASRTVQRARQRIGAVSEVTGFGAGKRSVWKLPICATDPPFVPIAPDKLSGTHGTNGGTDGDSEVFA